MFAGLAPVTPTRLVGKAAYDALTATYSGKAPSAGNWIGADDSDGSVVTTLVFDKGSYTTPTTGAGSAGLKAARELRSTLTSAHSSVMWLPIANHAIAHAAKIPHCKGFTFCSPHPSPGGRLEVYFKSSTEGNNDAVGVEC